MSTGGCAARGCVRQAPACPCGSADPPACTPAACRAPASISRQRIVSNLADAFRWNGASPPPGRRPRAGPSPRTPSGSTRGARPRRRAPADRPVQPGRPEASPAHTRRTPGARPRPPDAPPRARRVRPSGRAPACACAVPAVRRAGRRRGSCPSRSSSDTRCPPRGPGGEFRTQGLGEALHARLGRAVGAHHRRGTDGCQ